MSHLKPMDIVECIDDEPHLKQSTLMPVLGHIYRVASVRAVGDGQSVRLFEITPECYKGAPCRCGKCGWDARRFRKIEPPAKVATRGAWTEQKVPVLTGA